MELYNFKQPTLQQEFNRPLKQEFNRPVHDRVPDGRGGFKSPDQLFAEKYFTKLYGTSEPEESK